MFESLFIFIFGFCCSLYVCILFSSSQDRDSEANKSRIFLNIFFLNKKEIVENIVRSRVSRRTPILRAVAKRLVNNLISDQKLAGRIGDDICKLIIIRLEKLGVKALTRIAYQQSAYICIEISVDEIDATKFLQENVSTQNAAKNYEKIKNLLPYDWFTEWVGSFLINKLNKKLIVQLPETIQEKLQFKLSADVEIVGCSSNEHGPFLTDTIKLLTEEKST